MLVFHYQCNGTRISRTPRCLGGQLRCRKETGSIADPFAVAVIKDGATVGHVPKITSVCPVFLERNGSIVCHVMDHWRFSRDLPQGGMDCIMTFKGEAKLTANAKLLVENAEIQNQKREEKLIQACRKAHRVPRHG